MTKQLKDAIHAAMDVLECTGHDDLAHDLSSAILAEPETFDSVALVREFEVACGATLPAEPTQPPVEKLKLRLSLELEELYEKAQAMGLEGTFQEMLLGKSQALIGWAGKNCPGKDTNIYDPVALLDACCDQRYVQDGTVLTCGLQDVFYPAFAEVQRSNMSKFPTEWDEAVDSVDKYRQEGIAVSITSGAYEKPYVLKRIADGKILKSINYSKADLTQFL
jgi:predicted HAD superfamily Cof-like phosphohydrolase